jgi:hypothetical protein
MFRMRKFQEAFNPPIYISHITIHDVNPSREEMKKKSGIGAPDKVCSYNRLKTPPCYTVLGARVLYSNTWESSYEILSLVF